MNGSRTPTLRKPRFYIESGEGERRPGNPFPHPSFATEGFKLTGYTQRRNFGTYQKNRLLETYHGNDALRLYEDTLDR
ncbi:hypothetical protein SERLADRAFT_472836, partial [Serpula lacrymans var. lacrymans S7.9]